MTATQGSTANSDRKQPIGRVRERLKSYEFGALTAGELQNRIESGDSHPRDVEAMLADIRAILEGQRGDDARAGFADEFLRIASRNCPPAYLAAARRAGAA